MRKGLILALLAFAAASFGARSASAERVRLAYHGPPPSVGSCPREDEAFLTLRASLPTDEASDAHESEARVVVTVEDGRYVGKITLHAHDQTLSRDLESPSCSDLLRAVSFVLGVAYRETTPPAPADAGADEKALVPPSELAVVAPTPAPAAERRATDVANAPNAKTEVRRLELGLAARASALWGVTPGSSPRFEGYLELGVNRDSIVSPSFRAGAAYTSAGLDVEGGRADFSVLAGAASACPFRIGGGAGKMQLVPCARLELGDLHGEGTRIPSARDRHTLWGAAGAELTARWMLSSSVGLELGVAVLAPFRRQTYVIDPGRVIHQTGAVAFHAGAGVFFSAL